MAYHQLTEHFRYFFGRLNPSQTWRGRASSEHRSITALIEDPYGPAAALKPTCFLQGSYARDTSIYTINDVDIVALCQGLSYPGTTAGGGRSWSRDDIFAAIAAALQRDFRYAQKIRFTARSMCIKVDLGIAVEVLPAVLKAGSIDPQLEPFVLFRPETQQWEDGFARYHGGWLTHKNATGHTNGALIPLIKVVKHLRSLARLNAVSFHIECLLWCLDDGLFRAPIPDVIANVLCEIASLSAGDWYRRRLVTPCGDRDIFTASEWGSAEWHAFHAACVRWADVARIACLSQERDRAIATWQSLLGASFFPAAVG